MTILGRDGLRLVTVAVAALIAAACSSPAPSDAPTASPGSPSSSAASPSAATSPSPAAVHLSWTDCGSGFECATLTVPRDYSTAAGANVNLSLIRLRATDPQRRIGSLLTNPGGPGASGVDFVRSAAKELFSTDVRARFDIVGFDPRGVGLSTAVLCRGDLKGFLSTDPDPRTAAARAAVAATERAFGAACQEHVGELLPAVTTDNAARDLERLRDAVGDAGLTYVGFSYGTFLGAAYAARYPDKVRALVLDAAVDPSLDLTGRLTGQAASFEGALDRFLADCARRTECPFHEGGRPAQAFDRIVARLQQGPLPAVELGGDRVATAGSAWTAILGALYTPGFGWYYLALALRLAAEGDGSLLLAASDTLEGRNPDGSYSNLIEANLAINCADEPAPRDAAAVEQLAVRLAVNAPRVGRVVAYDALACSVWPVPSTRQPAPLEVHGLPPVVVVGGTGDPATPYAWSVSVARQLGSAVLLTRRGEGHTSYGQGIRCIDEAVDLYITTLKVPKAGLVCP